MVSLKEASALSALLLLREVRRRRALCSNDLDEHGGEGSFAGKGTKGNVALEMFSFRSCSDI